MHDGSVDIKAEARARVYAQPIEAVDPAQPDLFAQDAFWPIFERLRAEDPVHYAVSPDYGPFWSICLWDDIMAVDSNHGVFSSADGITLQSLESKAETAKRGTRPSFISMDPPRHDEQRKTVSPVVAPSNLQVMGPVIRERAGKILDSLPISEEFDWVEHVSKELTAMTLATLFEFPQEERQLLPFWSDMMTNAPGHGPVKSWEHKREVLDEMVDRFTGMWNERVNAPPQGDLISMLAHGESTKNMDRLELRREPGTPDHRRERHDAEHHLRLGLCAEQEPWRIRQAARQPRPDPRHGLRDHPLADAAGAHGPHGDPGHRAGR